jgi:hypothetical protein
MSVWMDYELTLPTRKVSWGRVRVNYAEAVRPISSGFHEVLSRCDVIVFSDHCTICPPNDYLSDCVKIPVVSTWKNESHGCFIDLRNRWRHRLGLKVSSCTSNSSPRK